MGENLKNGRSSSCGRCSKIGDKGPSFKHGKTGTDIHNIWLGMKDRCNNPNNSKYKYYGGRGISVCARWQISFSDFEQDVGPRPSLSHTIDRKDNSLGYEPNNVRWATKTEQTRNRNISIRDISGKSLAEISQDSGLSYSAVYGRFKRRKR